MRHDETGRHLRAPSVIAPLLALALALTFVGASLGLLAPPGATGPAASWLHDAPRAADRFEAPPLAPRIGVPVRLSSLRLARWVAGLSAVAFAVVGFWPRLGVVGGVPLGPDRVASAMMGLRRRGPPHTRS